MQKTTRNWVKVALTLALLVTTLSAIPSYGSGVAAAPTRATCPYDHRDYEVVSTPQGVTWDEAADLANRRGGYVAPIKSQVQLSWIVNTFGASALNGKWVGALRDRSCYTATWYNVDSSDNGFLNSSIPWANRDNTACKEDRAQFYNTTGRLNDLSKNGKTSGFLMIYNR